jgi:hypothetical protein
MKILSAFLGVDPRPDIVFSAFEAVGGVLREAVDDADRSTHTLQAGCARKQPKMPEDHASAGIHSKRRLHAPASSKS